MNTLASVPENLRSLVYTVTLYLALTALGSRAATMRMRSIRPSPSDLSNQLLEQGGGGQAKVQGAESGCKGEADKGTGCKS